MVETYDEVIGEISGVNEVAGRVRDRLVFIDHGHLSLLKGSGSAEAFEFRDGELHFVIERKDRRDDDRSALVTIGRLLDYSSGGEENLAAVVEAMGQMLRNENPASSRKLLEGARGKISTDKFERRESAHQTRVRLATLQLENIRLFLEEAKKDSRVSKLLKSELVSRKLGVLDRAIDEVSDGLASESEGS